MQIEAYITESAERLHAHTFSVHFIDTCELT